MPLTLQCTDWIGLGERGGEAASHSILEPKQVLVLGYLSWEPRWVPLSLCVAGPSAGPSYLEA